MRFSDLQEEENFPKEAGKAIADIGALAGRVRAALKGSYDTAKGELEGEGRRAAAQAVADAKKAQQAAEKEKQEADKKSSEEKAAKQKALGESVPQLVAKVVLDRTPDDPEMIEEFHELDAAQFNSVYAAIDKAKERLSKFPREMRKVLKASDFLQDKNRADNELNDMLGEQPEKGIEAAEEMLMKNIYDEQSVWSEVLTSDDGAGVAQNMLGLIKAISRDFAARNLAATGSGAKKSFPEGTGIVRIMSTQRQLIAMRLGLLVGAIEQLANGSVPTSPKVDAPKPAPAAPPKPAPKVEPKAAPPKVEPKPTPKAEKPQPKDSEHTESEMKWARDQLYNPTDAEAKELLRRVKSGKSIYSEEHRAVQALARVRRLLERMDRPN